MKKPLTIVAILIIVAGIVSLVCFLNRPPHFTAKPQTPKIYSVKSLTKQDMAEIGRSAAKGNLDVIDDLVRIADELYRNIDYQNEKLRVSRNLSLMRSVFTPMGFAAGKGSRTAMNALKKAHGYQRLSSFTPDAFGIAAGMGNKKALNILLDHQKNDILLSSAVFAMKYAADNNELQAVDFLVEVINDPDSKPLWHGASQGLEGAASMGNKQAQQALKTYQKDK